MAFAAGTRLGVYEISGLIGVGGMGEVYKAHDRRLNRTVAIKVLPEHIAADPDLKQRFEREAKAISSLSHPHICTLFDVGTDNGVEFLVLEYLEGETLAQRLTKGALPLPQVLRYGVEIAEALEQAHRRGVTHRDLKPGNVMLTQTGAKLLDFGLAKLRPTDARGSSSESTAIPEASRDLTAKGAWLGTLQYMAPEQLEGRSVDHRADVFAFGAIVYEMATGKKAFDGQSQASLIGAILKDDPQPISVVQPLSPRALDAVVATCLEKDPDQRWQSAGDVGRQLRLMLASGSQPSAGSERVGAVALGGWRRAVAIALVSAAVAGLCVWGLTQLAPPERNAVTRFAITPLAGTRLTGTPGYDIAISPDGTQIAYFAASEDDATRTALYVRNLDELEPKLVAGTEGIVGIATSPFFSPDGRSIGFGTVRNGIARIAVGGGTPRDIVDTGTQFAGGAWASDDSVIFSSIGVLYRVSASGDGTPERFAETAQMPAVAPMLLPGGRALLYTLDPGDTEQAVILDLDTGENRIVVEDATNARYAPSGHLVFGRGSTLMAAPFDLDRLAITGEPVVLVEGVRRNAGAAADYALSDTGTLVYVSAADAVLTRTVSWVDRDGNVLGSAVNDPGANARDPRLSPDARRLALTIGAEGDGRVWLYNLDGRPPIPVAEEGDAHLPIWSPDSAQIAYVANLGGTDLVFTSDGSNRTPQQLWPGLSAEPSVWLAGDELIATRFDAQTGKSDVIVAALQGDNVARDLPATPDTEFSPALSPDGRWLAYVSDRTGQLEVWVMPYAGGAPERVSSRGGVEPVWSRDSRELFYRQETGGMMAVAVDERGEFQEPVHLFEGSYVLGSPGTVRSYDVAADGRFLIVGHGLPSAGGATTSIVVVQNWPEELEQRER